MLQVTPNGPWGTEVHPSMPISLPEVLAQVRSCLVAGADSVHLHVRDACGAETLDPALVNEACVRVREVAAELGVDLEVGLTTGAWIVPDLAERIAMIRDWEGVDCATVNLSEPGFERVMAAMGDVGIGVDIGLWAPAELDRLYASGVLADAYRVNIELDPGEPYRLSGDPVGIARAVRGARRCRVSVPAPDPRSRCLDVAARRGGLSTRRPHARRLRGFGAAARRSAGVRQRRAGPGGGAAP